MEDLKKQNLEDAAMLDKSSRNIILKKITKNNKFKLLVNTPLNNLAIEFLDKFSNELKKLKETNKYPDLVYPYFQVIQ